MIFVGLALIAQTDAAVFVKLERLAEGVYAAVRNEPPGLAVDCNVLFVVNRTDVVMVDSNIGPESASATLDALAKVTKKPVSRIVATHYHDDHMGGISKVRERFPNVQVIAHESAPDAIEKLLMPARKGMIDVAPQMSAFLKGLIDKGKGFGGWSITEEERQAHQNDIRIADRYAREMPGIPLPRPDTLVEDKMVIKAGGRSIEILHLGEGHTPSDLVVWLPKERIAAVGDLVVYPVPLVGGLQSNVVAWPKTLAKVRALKPTSILPGHGPVMASDSYLKQMEGLFDTVTARVHHAMREGRDEKTAKIDLSEQQVRFCGSSKLCQVLFEQYVIGPSITSAFRVLTARSGGDR